jgi:hypothetical protein
MADFTPLRPDLKPVEDQASAYIIRYARRNVKLMALTETEVQIVSSANTKITTYLSWSSFWFGLFVNAVVSPDCPAFTLAVLFKYPFYLALIGVSGLIAAGIEWKQKRSLYGQINRETEKVLNEQISSEQQP